MRVLASGLFASMAMGCGELPNLVTPDPGSCPDTLDNGWPAVEAGDRLQAAESEQGYEVGDIAPDFNLVDQFGNETCLWQLQGKYVVLDTGAKWCSPCRLIAEHVACVQEAYGDDVVYVTLITEGFPQGTPSVFEDVVEWSDEFELGKGTQTPVLLDSGGVYAEGFPGDGLPSFLLLDPDLRIIYGGETATAEREIRNMLDQLLPTDSTECGEIEF